MSYRKIEVEISLDGEELAAQFWDMSACEQVDFFNQNLFTPCDFRNGSGKIQIDWITEKLDDEGKKFITALYESMQEWERTKGSIENESIC